MHVCALCGKHAGVEDVGKGSDVGEGLSTGVNSEPLYIDTYINHHAHNSATSV
jgi:hypothetical protein